jgi:hypothetical protein
MAPKPPLTAPQPAQPGPIWSHARLNGKFGLIGPNMFRTDPKKAPKKTLKGPDSGTHPLWGIPLVYPTREGYVCKHGILLLLRCCVGGARCARFFFLVGCHSAPQWQRTCIALHHIHLYHTREPAYCSTGPRLLLHRLCSDLWLRGL